MAYKRFLGVLGLFWLMGCSDSGSITGGGSTWQGDGSIVNGVWDLVLDSTQGNWYLNLRKSKDSISGSMNAWGRFSDYPTGRVTGIIKKGGGLPIMTLWVIPDSLTYQQAVDLELRTWVRVDLDTFNLAFEGSINVPGGRVINSGKLYGWKRP